MRVLCFGQQNWDYCWTGKQQLMSRLARRGHQVLYIDPDSIEDGAHGLDALRALAPVRTGLGIRDVAPGLTVCTHVHAPVLRWRINQWRRPRLLRAAIARLGFESATRIALHPKVLPLVEAAGPGPLLYYAVDEATAFPNIPPDEQRRIRDAEDTLLRRSSVAMAVSPRLAARFRTLQPRTYHLENGADVAHFSPEALAAAPPHQGVAALPRPRLVFVGQVDERIDQPLVAALARARPDWSLVFAGRRKRGVDFATLETLPNVRFLGYQPYEQLPGILREADVCIVPYRLTDLTHACNPLKIYEYLATGRPVVATPLEGIGICREVVRLAEGAAAFTAALDAALADPAAGRTERLALAQANSWEARTDALEMRLQETVEHHATRHGRRAPQLRRPGSPAARSQDAPPLPEDERVSTRAAVALRAFGMAGRMYHLARMLGRAAAGQRPVRIRRILVARQARLGDLIAFLPALELLRERYPDAHIVFAAQPGSPAPLLLGSGAYADEIRELDFLSSAHSRERLTGALRLFAEGFDLVVSGEAYQIIRESFFTGAPYRVGFANGHPLQRLNTAVLPYDPTCHEVDNNRRLIEGLTGRPSPRRAPQVQLPPAHPERLRTLTGGADGPGARLVIVHAGAQKPSRRWPVERFGALVTDLLAHHPDVRIVLTGSRDEASLVEGIQEAIPAPLRPRVVDAVGQTDLPTMAALMDASAAVVCNDTGVMHLARARGAALVALLGPENDRRWGPYPVGPGASAIALRHQTPCGHCYRWECEALFCLRALSVDEVREAVERVMQMPRGGEGAVPLTIVRHRHDWASLAARGAALPVVSAIVFTPAAAAAALGTAPAAVQPASPAARERTMRAVLAQRYPMLDPVLVQLPEEPPSGWEGLRPLTATAATPDAVWRCVLEGTTGELIAAATPPAEWPPGKIAGDVSELVRRPELEGAPGASAAGGGSPAVSVTFRRSALQRWLIGVEAAPTVPGGLAPAGEPRTAASR